MRLKNAASRAGLWLGLAGALALMTKYWVLTMIGAIGLAALIHPERLKFLRSPAPWVAIATLVVAMIPHLVWLKDVDFVPLTYAGDVYGLSSRAQSVQLVLGYVGHNLALLAVPVALAAIALALDAAMVGETGGILRCSRMLWSRGPNPGVNTVAGAQHLDHPDRGRDRAAARRPDFHDLYEDRLGNLAVLPDAAGAGRDPVAARSENRAVSYRRDLARRHARSACRLALHRDGRDGGQSKRRLDLWRALRACARTDGSLAQRFHSRWAVVAGTTEMGEPMTFYSPDHPAPFTPGEFWSSGLTSLEEAKRLGFIGICDTTDGRLPVCEAWMKENGKDAEQLAITTQRFFHGHPGPAISWKVYIVPPAK